MARSQVAWAIPAIPGVEEGVPMAGAWSRETEKHGDMGAVTSL